MSATIRDVARVAGVGRGTVSRVLNDSPRVHPATRERVRAVMAELGYSPSPIARRLSLGKTHTVGVVVVFLTRPSVVERLRGIEFALSATPYDLTVFNVESPERRAAVLHEIVRRHRVDGLIVVSLSPRGGEAIAIEQAGVPTVLVDAFHRRLPRVVSNDVAGGVLAARHLLELGHARIAFVGYEARNPFAYPASRLRCRGLRQALTKAGVPLPAEYVRGSGATRGQARGEAAALLALPSPPTAIVCGADTEAIGVIDAARDAGLRVPEDLSVVGYDDIELAAYLGLTTVHQPLFDSGVRGAQLLLDLMAGGRQHDAPVVRREVLDVRLVARSTTGPAASATLPDRNVAALTGFQS